MTSYHDLGLRQRPIVEARFRQEPLNERFAQMAVRADGLVAEPFRGLTTDGLVVPNLYNLKPTGVSTAGMVDAAKRFLDVVGRDRAQLPIESDTWRRWHNVHAYLFRHGAGLDSLDDKGRSLALKVVHSALSDEGFGLTRDVMRLNHTIGEITGRWAEYGEWTYWLAIYGEPSATEAWGWQFDGHHVNLSCFVLGDQVTLTPAFLGSEPCWAEEGDHVDVQVFDQETEAGLALVRSLDADQRRQAALAASILPGKLAADRLTQYDHRLQAGAFGDNAIVAAEGIAANDLSDYQRRLLMQLVGVYIDRQSSGHARIRAEEVAARLADMRFLWLGGTDDDSVFYYRLHSPVLWIEFDHQPGIAFANDEPTRHHVHTIVRSPNGNDYGRDLLRQHYAKAH